MAHVECMGGDDIQFWEVVESRKSFPSGHAVIALYSATFMVVRIQLECKCTLCAVITLICHHFLEKRRQVKVGGP